MCKTRAFVGSRDCRTSLVVGYTVDATIRTHYTSKPFLPARVARADEHSFVRDGMDLQHAFCVRGYGVEPAIRSQVAAMVEPSITPTVLQDRLAERVYVIRRRVHF